MAKGSVKLSTHESLEREDDDPLPSERNFGVTISVVLFLVFVLPAIISGNWRWWALVGSVAFILPALLYPSLLAVPNRLWYKFGLLIHGVVNPLLLGIMFGSIILIGLIRRLFNRDPMNLRFDPAAASYWIERKPRGPNIDDFPHQF